MQRIQNAVKDQINNVLHPYAFRKELLKNDKIDLTIEKIKSGEVNRFQVENSETFKKLVINLQERNPGLNYNYISEILIKSMFEFTDGINGEIQPMFFGFDSRAWLIEDTYRKNTIDFYNIIKETWNIFDVVDKVPQYNELVNLLKLIYVCND